MGTDRSIGRSGLSPAARRIVEGLEAAAVRRGAAGVRTVRRASDGATMCQDAGRWWGEGVPVPQRTVVRPFIGPLPATWNGLGRVPYWYVWWRLHGVQDGRCAACPGPVEVVDHCHVTGLVRGLLCYDCNHREALHARDLAAGWHEGERCWFQEYWRAPPAGCFGWYWPYRDRSTSESFLTEPPAWVSGRR